MSEILAAFGEVCLMEVMAVTDLGEGRSSRVSSDSVSSTVDVAAGDSFLLTPTVPFYLCYLIM